MDPGITYKSGLSIFLACSFLLQLIPCGIQAQEPPNFVPSYQTVNVYDVNGHPISGSSAGDIIGTPLFIAVWKPGLIRLVDGRSFTAVPVELDLVQQTVHFKKADGTEQQIEPGLVRQVIILDDEPNQKLTYQFVTGYPPIDNQTPVSFYLLLDSGKVCFLESVRKRFIQEKNELTSETKKEYRTYSDFYVYTQGRITRIKKDNKFFLILTADKQAQMENFIKDNKISLKSEEDIRRFIHYYNGLP